MKPSRVLAFSSVATFVIAVGLFVYLMNASKALSYLSSDPKACINCHVMNTQYATWQHSSHAQRADCVGCHLPQEGFINKYIEKGRDGWNHSVAFTFNTFENAIQISDHGSERVQVNCIACHEDAVEIMIDNEARYSDLSQGIQPVERKCWDCHREVAHGKTRSLTTTPYALDVRELN
jgi:cytochrome c nitrite reductase small subunit